MPADTSQRKSWDGVAAALSSLCLLHCLAVPLLVGVSPALASGVVERLFHGPEWVHWAMLLVAVPVSFRALMQGMRLHSQVGPFLWAVLGMTMMGLGAAIHGVPIWEPALTVAGGFVVAWAHWANWQARRLVH